MGRHRGEDRGPALPQQLLRTRTSFDVGANQLGGHAVVLSSGGMWPLEFEDGAVMLDDAEEHVKEAAKVLSATAT